MFVLSRRGLCNGPITRPEESYRLWCVSECDLDNSKRRGPRPHLGCCATGKERNASFIGTRETRSLLCKLYLRTMFLFTRTLWVNTWHRTTFPCYLKFSTCFHVPAERRVVHTDELYYSYYHALFCSSHAFAEAKMSETSPSPPPPRHPLHYNLEMHQPVNLAQLLFSLYTQRFINDT
jgi:hypothetical protein